MLIRHKSGAEEHVSNELGRTLVHAGLVEEVKGPAAKNPMLPQFGDAKPLKEEYSVGIFKTTTDKPYLALELKVGHTVYRFLGDPKFINAKRGRHFVSGFGREVPEVWVKKYTAEWNSQPSLRAANVQQQG